RAARSENASCSAATRSQVAIRSSTLPAPAHVLQTSRRIFVGWTLETYSTPPYFFTLGTVVSMVRLPAHVGQIVIYDAFRMVRINDGASGSFFGSGLTPSSMGRSNWPAVITNLLSPMSVAGMHPFLVRRITCRRVSPVAHITCSIGMFFTPLPPPPL